MTARRSTEHFPTSEPAGTAQVKPWSAPARVAVSVLLILHLAAVFTAPFTFAASGPGLVSPLAARLMNFFRPYIDWAYWNHGYFFFAPNPGPSHLMRCRLEFDDGRPPLELWYPDRKRQRPRLLYHRHFMLAEQLHMLFVPEEPPPDYPSPDGWRGQRAAYVARRAAFIEHLKHRYGASRVSLVRVEHRPFSPEECLRGVAINDPSFYQDLPETVADLPAPGGSRP